MINCWSLRCSLYNIVGDIYISISNCILWNCRTGTYLAFQDNKPLAYLNLANATTSLSDSLSLKSSVVFPLVYRGCSSGYLRAFCILDAMNTELSKFYNCRGTQIYLSLVPHIVPSAKPTQFLFLYVLIFPSCERF